MFDHALNRALAFKSKLRHINLRRGQSIKVLVLGSVGIYTLTMIILAQIWSQEPRMINIDKLEKNASEQSNQSSGGRPATGDLTVGAVSLIAHTLLEKPGGYLSNDMFPPSSFFGFRILDNMPSWEFGALVALRDSMKVLRNDISRSQSQSMENKNLAVSEPKFSFSNDSWILPRTEDEYMDGLLYLLRYRLELGDRSKTSAQFYARADNLSELLSVMEKRLGGLVQRLSASESVVRINTDLSGDPTAKQSTPSPDVVIAQTPWLEIDNVFYEARGYTWAIIPVLKAIEIDFEDVLKKKNAQASLRQAIMLLEKAQSTTWSPMVLNGSGFGIMSNYSNVMVSYIAPANAAIINLRELLKDG